MAAYTVEIGPMSDYTDFVTLEDGKQGKDLQRCIKIKYIIKFIAKTKNFPPWCLHTILYSNFRHASVLAHSYAFDRR